MEVGKYALAHSTKDAFAKFSKQHPPLLVHVLQAMSFQEGW